MKGVLSHRACESFEGSAQAEVLQPIRTTVQAPAAEPQRGAGPRAQPIRIERKGTADIGGGLSGIDPSTSQAGASVVGRASDAVARLCRAASGAHRSGELGRHPPRLAHRAWAWLGLACVAVVLAPTAHAQTPADQEPSSISATPPSFVFPPNDPIHFPVAVPSSRLVFGRNGKPAQIVELRGWVRTSGDWGCNPVDPDWHFDLEPDTAWTDARGIDLRQVLRVGNLFGVATNSFNFGSQYRAAAVPLIHVELNGWRDSAHPGESAPADWGFQTTGDPPCADVKWPFSPLRPIATRPQPDFASGQYVRMVGSLTTDQRHTDISFPSQILCNMGILAGCDWQDTRVLLIREFWARGLDATDPADPARWTELHPPDTFIVYRPEENPPQQVERVYGLAVGADPSHASSGGHAEETMDVDFVAPTWTGAAGMRRVVTARELPQEVDLSTIVEGNATRTGAQVTSSPDRVHVHVKVAAGATGTGRFSALYRVGWETLEDGKIVREQSDAAVYILFGGAKFWIPNPTVLASYGGWARVRVVPNGTLANVRVIPVDGTLLREQSNPATYVVFGGAKFWVPSPEEFAALGYSTSSIGVVPDGSLTAIPAIPRDRTLLRERSSAAVYVIFRGKRYWITSAQDFAAHGFSWADVRVIPNGSVAQIPDGGSLPTWTTCQQWRDQLAAAQAQRADLQSQLADATGTQRTVLVAQINRLNAQIADLQNQLVLCG